MCCFAYEIIDFGSLGSPKGIVFLKKSLAFPSLGSHSDLEMCSFASEILASLIIRDSFGSQIVQFSLRNHYLFHH